MAEQEEVNVRCIGDVHYLDKGLGFTKAEPRKGKKKTIYQHHISYNGKDYILRLQNSYHHVQKICVVFFDSVTTLLEYYSIALLIDYPTVFVLVTNKGCESHPVLHEYIRCSKVIADVLPGHMCIEWKVDQTSDPKNLSFLETLSQAIITIHNEIDEMKFICYLLSSNFKNFVIAYIKNLLSSADSNRKDNVNQIVLDELFSLSNCYGAKWWSIPSSYSGSMSSTKPPIKIKAADDVNTLYASIDHDYCDIHSLCFYRQECIDIVDKISVLASRNVCIKRIIIKKCKGTLSFRFLSKLNEGLEYLIVQYTDVKIDEIIFWPEIISTLRVLIFYNCKITQDEVPSVIGNLKNLEYLDLSENHFKRLPESFSNLCRLKYLHLRGIGLTTDEVPSVIGNLKNLEYLNLAGNNFKRLPESFSNLDRMKYFLLDNKADMVFPPSRILKRPAEDVIQYLKELQQQTTKNREAKVMVVGQEDVGKSTLVESATKFFTLRDTDPPEKTDGIEISTLKVKSSKINVFDLAGDVEFHNTHALFFSPNCLYLAVFDLSNVTISKESRSTDQFCRLELWLQTIASQDPNAYVIIVGTKCDIASPEMLTRVRDMLSNVLTKYCSQHVACNSIYEVCMLCNPEVFKQDSLLHLDKSNVSSESTSMSSIPHILGYQEVSGKTNKNVGSLKRQIHVALTYIKQYAKTDTIPKRWLRFRKSILAQLSNEHQLTQQPIVTLTSIREKAANEAGIHMEESLVAMLRFFHSQGDFLWYEDIPEMKEVVILNPQWLSNQLRTLISYLPEVNAICEGFLPHSDLPTIWSDMSKENRSRLMTVFRSVGLCISVKDDEDLFPCQLSIGWPDREMWTQNPGSDENQTSLLFRFSFVPASLFPDLIIAVSKRKDFFPWNVKPLYYRFNAVYITKRLHQCHLHGETLQEGSVLAYTSCSDTDCSLDHRVHMEMMPHTNSLKVTIRGKQPCCQVSDIRSMIKTVQSQRYPGITYKELLMCPECELKKLHNPSTFDIQKSTGGYCCKGHKVGSTDDVLAGKLKRTDVAVLKREIIEAFDDHSCPKLFVVLPINLDSLSLKDRFVYSLIRDGYAVHLLCECPDQWHFLSSPGFRVGKPKEFFKKFGVRVCKLLRYISVLGRPLKIAATVDPHSRVAAAVATEADNICKDLKSLLDDYSEKYPHLKASLGSADDDLKDLKSSRGLQRSELSRFLEVAAPGRDFGPLICTYVDKYNEWLWLCEEHYQQYEIVERH